MVIRSFLLLWAPILFSNVLLSTKLFQVVILPTFVSILWHKMLGPQKCNTKSYKAQ